MRWLSTPGHHPSSTVTRRRRAAALAYSSSPTGTANGAGVLLADSGDRYAETYFRDEWLAQHGIDPDSVAEALSEFERSARWG